jgi:hypothetical protein
MSLREQFAPDIERIFINVDEMGEWREFRIADGHNGFIVFTAKVVWDKEAAKQQPITKIHGVYLADVMCYIATADLPRAPVAGELIYSPANSPYEVIDCTIEEHLYSIALAAYRSQPAHYGSN